MLPTLLSEGHNLFGSLDGCGVDLGPADIFNEKAKLEPLRSNGGFTKTHALKRPSKARDAGSRKRAGRPGACERTDQRGVKRPQGRRCDIGAYELK